MRHVPLLIACIGASAIAGSSGMERELQRAARGDPGAIRAIARLRPAADGAQAEAIDAAMSRALRIRPALVLSLVRADPALPRPVWLCQDRAIEPDVADHRRFEQQAAAALAAMREPALRSLRDDCLASLHRAG